MPERIPQSTTIRVPIQAFLSSDHVSPATGKTIAITISKNGGAYGNPSGGATNAVEIASGSYYVDLTTTDTGTAGPLFILGTASAVDPVNILYNVVNAHTGGYDALPNAQAGTTGGIPTSALVRAATCQSGSTTTLVKLDASASSTNDIYVGDWLAVQVGAAPWQYTPISAYDGSTKIATVTALNATIGAPASGDSFQIIGRGYVATVADIWSYATRILTAATNITTSGNVLNVNANGAALTQEFLRTGTAQAGTTTTITLDSGASATNNLYNGNLVFITGNTGAGQVRTITGYNGTSKIANVDRPFVTAPTSASTFALVATDNMALNANLQGQTAPATTAILSGTATAGTATTLTLTGGLSTNSVYVGDLLTLTGGTGAGQTRTIVAYNGTSKVATVDRNWTTTPDNTSTFNVLASVTPTVFSDQGVAQAGTSTTITLASTASSVNSIYVGSVLTILSGTDSGDASLITAYNGSTKVATVSPAFAVTPDTTSAYAVIPTQSGSGQAVGTTDVNVITWGSTPVVLTGGFPEVGVGAYASGQDPNTLWQAGAMAACTGLPTTNGQALTYATQQRNNKEAFNKTTGVATLYENDGVTVKQTQTYTSDATSATRTAAA